MKRVFRFLILMLMLGAPLAPDASAKNDDSEKKEISFRTVKKGGDDRLLGQEIKGFYCPRINLVELTCYGTKETVVYIVSARGEEISNSSFDSSISPYNIFDVPQRPGTYYIVIDSPVLYAEGMFLVE